MDERSVLRPVGSKGQRPSIGLPMRSAIYFLPEAIESFESSHAGVSVTPEFTPLHNYDRFLRGEQDMVFARAEDMKRVPDIKIHPLFESRIYLISELVDPLAEKDVVTVDDLTGRRLMVGGGSQPELRSVQNRVLEKLHLEHFNSNDHETTLTNIASHKGICLAPGFLNDHNGEFAWAPFDCKACPARHALPNADMPHLPSRITLLRRH